MRLIDADALCDDVMERYCKDCEKRRGYKKGKWRVIYEIGEAPCRACDVDDLKMELDEAPTIDAEPVRRGEWIKDEKTTRCSKCGGAPISKITFRGETIWEQFLTEEYHYCPYCGAKMDEEEL